MCVYYVSVPSLFTKMSTLLNWLLCICQNGIKLAVLIQVVQKTEISIYFKLRHIP